MPDLDRYGRRASREIPPFSAASRAPCLSVIDWLSALRRSCELGRVVRNLHDAGDTVPPAAADEPSRLSTLNDFVAEDSQSKWRETSTDPRVDVSSTRCPVQPAICGRSATSRTPQIPTAGDVSGRVSRIWLRETFARCSRPKRGSPCFCTTAVGADPHGIITGGHGNQTGRMISIRQGEKINASALKAMFRKIIANNRAGGWRKLKALQAGHYECVRARAEVALTAHFNFRRSRAARRACASSQTRRSSSVSTSSGGTGTRAPSRSTPTNVRNARLVSCRRPVSVSSE